MQDIFTHKVIVDAEFFKLSGEPLSYVDAQKEEMVKVLGNIIKTTGIPCDYWHEENFLDINQCINIEGKIWENYILLETGEAYEYIPSYLTLNIDAQKVIFNEHFIFYDNCKLSSLIRYPVSHFLETWENISKCNTYTNVGKVSAKVQFCENNEEFYTGFIKYVWIINNICFLVTEKGNIYEVIKCKLPKRTSRRISNFKLNIIQNATFHNISSNEEIIYDDVVEDTNVRILGINYNNNKHIEINAKKFSDFFITEDGKKYVVIPNKDKSHKFILNVIVYWYEIYQDYKYIKILPSDIQKVCDYINDGIEVKAIFGICEKEAYISGEIEKGQLITSRINKISLNNNKVQIETNNSLYVTEHFIN